MNCKLRTRRAFTLIELVVAIAILVMLISFAGVIFKVSINRTAKANTEIMQKLRAITDQLNVDFKDMRKDGVILVAWKAVLDNNTGRYVRFDTILFFTNGDFQSYRGNNVNGKIIRGNIARVCYMLAKDGFGVPAIRAWGQKPEQRILARSQHILTADTNLDKVHDLASIPIPFDPFIDNPPYEAANNSYEYDRESLASWRIGAPQPGLLKNKLREMLTVCTDVQIGIVGAAVSGGLTVSASDPNTFHMLLCESVGELKIQGWYEAERRWFPKIDPDYDGDLSDSDFFINSSGAIDSGHSPAILYPRWNFESGSIGVYPRDLLTESNFDLIPGLGRALKFTFTLYDSKGIIKNGRVFTHIVYLGD
ncbi:MAG: prepilin-type N-terminal cleavage/methylation domain-containing protein [Planctomycetota bacterium]